MGEVVKNELSGEGEIGQKLMTHSLNIYLIQGDTSYSRHCKELREYEN